MNPAKESIQLLDRLSIRLLFVLSSLIVGISMSALFVGDYGGLKAAMGPELPYAIIAVFPLSAYIMTSILLEVGCLFLSKRVYSNLRRSVLRKNLVSIEKVEYQIETYGKADALNEGLTAIKSKKGKTLEQAEEEQKKLAELSQKQQEWYEQAAHINLAAIVFRFSVVVLLLHRGIPWYLVAFAVLTLHLHLLNNLRVAGFSIISLIRRRLAIIWSIWTFSIMLKVSAQDGKNQTLRHKLVSYFVHKFFLEEKKSVKQTL